MASRAVKGEPVKPEPERVAGTVFPYRGVENHGVKPLQDPPEYTDDQWPADDESVKYVAGPTEDDPLPVRVVNQHSVSRRVPRTQQVPVTESTRLIGRNDDRISVTIANHSSTVSIYLTHEAVSADFARANGFRILGSTNVGSRLEKIETTEALFATTETGAAVTVGILEIIEIPV
jgi:hypothetical protein